MCNISCQAGKKARHEGAKIEVAEEAIGESPGGKMTVFWSTAEDIKMKTGRAQV